MTQKERIELLEKKVAELETVVNLILEKLKQPQQEIEQPKNLSRFEEVFRARHK